MPLGEVGDGCAYASPVSRVLVIGLARSGRAAVSTLRATGENVVAYDADSGLDSAGIDAEIQLGDWDDAFLDGVGTVVKSPGVPSDAPPVAAARARGIPIVSEIELGARLLSSPLIGVTGTNGKTTTSALLGAILETAGWNVEVAGNIGRPLTSLVGAVDDDTWVVCELSSFQLEDVETLRPRVAVLTNLEPDHLDRHGSFDAYARAKLRAFERQGPDDVAVVPQGFGPLPGNARRVEFAADDELPAEPRDSRRAQPGERRCRDSRRTRDRSPRRGDRRRPPGVPGSSTASRRSRRSTASSTSTTPRRRTRPQRSARSRRSRAAAST